MWIFTKYGFFSAVCARLGAGELSSPVDPDRVMVRARQREHLEKLQERFDSLLGESEIRETSETDYRYRIIIPKTDWVRVVESLAVEMDYDNFKDSAAELHGSSSEYVRALHDVWDKMYSLQD